MQRQAPQQGLLPVRPPWLRAPRAEAATAAAPETSVATAKPGGRMGRLWNTIGACVRIGGRGTVYEIGERRLIEEGPLSEGGFAFVVQVRDASSGEVFALKKVLCQDKESLEAAEREAELLENLPTHKNIVSYFGHSIVPQESGSGKLLLLLLELCPGGHLIDLLDNHKGVLPHDELLSTFMDIAEAVFCLHSMSPPVQHRDLKLENILRGSDGCWKLIDFGSWTTDKVDLSETAVRQLTLIQEDIGRGTTPMYRPPEMVDVYQRFAITCAVDIWMLGCILYSLMFNQHPFQEASTLAIRSAQFKLPAREPSHTAKFLDLLVWLMAQDPKHRPTARQLVLHMWQWRDEPELVLPEPVREHQKKLLASAAAARTATAPLKPITAAAPKAAAGGSGGRSRGDNGNKEAATASSVAQDVAPQPPAVEQPALGAATEPWVASFASFAEENQGSGGCEVGDEVTTNKRTAGANTLGESGGGPPMEPPVVATPGMQQQPAEEAQPTLESVESGVSFGSFDGFQSAQVTESGVSAPWPAASMGALAAEVEPKAAAAATTNAEKIVHEHETAASAPLTPAPDASEDVDE